jgi:ribosomal protein S18 acetylase RimI-like enzyme
MIKIEQIGIEKFEEFYDLFLQMANYSIPLGHPGATVDFPAEIKENNFKAFKEKRLECHILYENNKPAGYITMYETYSTFLGKVTVYLDDLFVIDECRGKGYGTILMDYLKKLSKERDYGRIDWHTPENNTKAQQFYEKLNAKNCHYVWYRFTTDQY